MGITNAVGEGITVLVGARVEVLVGARVRVGAKVELGEIESFGVFIICAFALRPLL
jgi:hypothetical protein